MLGNMRGRGQRSLSVPDKGHGVVW